MTTSRSQPNRPGPQLIPRRVLRSTQIHHPAVRSTATVAERSFFSTHLFWAARPPKHIAVHQRALRNPVRERMLVVPDQVTPIAVRTSAEQELRPLPTGPGRGSASTVTSFSAGTRPDQRHAMC